jgi:hypothetical protein
MVPGHISRTQLLVGESHSVRSLLCSYVDGRVHIGVSDLIVRVSLLLIDRLGDRHNDNILLLGNTGGVLHVDFDCLFDKVSRMPIAGTKC